MQKTILALLWCATSLANAHVVISGTRVIYPSDAKVVAVELNNPDSTPSLVQSWIEYPTAQEGQKVPFIITPMVGRVEPNGKQSLRIRQVGADLPQDRESLFYLNVLDIPAKPKDIDSESYLQVTLRNQLKFFYRPSKLPYPVVEAYDKVTWHWAEGTLSLNNPTPYFITYAGVVLKDNETVLYETAEIDMIAPLGTLTVNAPSPTAPKHIMWHVINDYGGVSSGIAPVQY